MNGRGAVKDFTLDELEVCLQDVVDRTADHMMIFTGTLGRIGT